MLEALFIAGAVQQMARTNRAMNAGEMASRLATEVRSQNDFIIADVEKLFMITQALWTILKDEHGYTEDVLLRKIKAIDLSDGKLDDKVAKAEQPACPKCGRKLMGKRSVCLYCGATVIRDPFER